MQRADSDEKQGDQGSDSDNRPIAIVSSKQESQATKNIRVCFI